jgi:hypothetical protein
MDYLGDYNWHGPYYDVWSFETSLVIIGVQSSSGHWKPELTEYYMIYKNEI